MDAEQWFYKFEGKPHGPFNAVQFEKLVRVRTVSPDTEVSNDGKTWQTLAAALASPADDADATDWMNAPTLMPGDVPPPTGHTDKKAAPPG